MRLQLEKQRDFLFQAYFGTEGNEFNRFVFRAYRDMNRTLRGIGKLPNDLKDEIFTSAKDIVKGSFSKLREITPSGHENLCAKFDDWHTKSCNALKKHYVEKLKTSSQLQMTYGQAQKWLNMTMKYCWVCGDDGQLDPWFSAAHMPIDSIILKAIKSEIIDAQLPSVTWSKWNDESEYRHLQTVLRRHAEIEGKSSLELEFEWWPRYNLMQERQT